MKVIIAGSRGITDLRKTDPRKVRTIIHGILNSVNITPSEVISGDAVGVDKIGESYAQMFSIPVVRMPADWGKYGKAAGTRNLIEKCIRYKKTLFRSINNTLSLIRRILLTFYNYQNASVSY